MVNLSFPLTYANIKGGGLTTCKSGMADLAA